MRALIGGATRKRAIENAPATPAKASQSGFVKSDLSSAEDEVRREDMPASNLADLERLDAERLVFKDIIGDSDGRAPVSSSMVPPYRAIVKVITRYAQDGKLYGCSGSLIGPDAVLTAAHCVFNSRRNARGYAYSVTVVPGLYPKSPVPASGPRLEQGGSRLCGDSAQEVARCSGHGTCQ